MKKKLPSLDINPLDNLFSTEEERQDNRLEKIMKIPLEEIHDFKDHPFKVRMDEDMEKLVGSVRENGVLVPVLVRPDKDGNGYEMIAGHRRKYAMSENGMAEIDAIVRNLDDDQATIIMVDSNIQREYILPSERGFAYKMKLEAMKHQGKRTDLTSSQLVQKLKGKYSVEKLADEVGESYKQVQRYIRLTYLIEPLRDMVDEIREDGLTMALNPAYEISFLTEQEQWDLEHYIYDYAKTPSLAQAQELKRRSQAKVLDTDFMEEILSMDKPNQKEKISFKMEELDQYFPKSYSQRQRIDIIHRLLENWAKRKEKSQER